jgi:hypothetical protein
MHGSGFALTAVGVLALAFAATGALALGSEILDPAFGAIDENMPADAQETSGVQDVLEDVAERLDEVLPEDVEVPEPADEGVEHIP